MASKIPVYIGGSTPKKASSTSKACVVCDDGPEVYKSAYRNIFSSSYDKKLERITKVSFTKDSCHSDRICRKCSRNIDTIVSSLDLMDSVCRNVKETQQKYRKKRGLVALPGSNQSSPVKPPTKKRGLFREIQPKVTTPGVTIPAQHEVENQPFCAIGLGSEQTVTVTIQTASKKMTRNVTDDNSQKIVKNVAFGTAEQVAAALWSDDKISALLKDKTIQDINKELDCLCSLSNPSVLRTVDPVSLVNVTSKSISKELQDRAPVFHKMVNWCTGGSSRKRKEADIKENPVKVASAASVILKARCQQMSAWTVKNSLTLEHGGCSTMAINRLAKQFVTASSSTTRARKKILAKDFDSIIVKQKERVHNESTRQHILEKVGKMVKEDKLTLGELYDAKAKPLTKPSGRESSTSNIAPNILFDQYEDNTFEENDFSSVDDIIESEDLTLGLLEENSDDHLSIRESTLADQELLTAAPLRSGIEFPTIDFTTDLAWSFFTPEQSTCAQTESLEDASEPANVLHDSDSESHSDVKKRNLQDLREATNEELFNDVLNDILTECTVSGLDLSVVEKLQKQLQLGRGAGYQIIGDNVDLLVKARHMASDRQNKDIHWFFLYAALDDVSGYDIQDSNDSKLSEMPISQFLPNRHDLTKLKYHLNILWSRVIVEWMPSFHCLEKAVVRHIPHKYQHAMSKKSTVVPLGLLFKNENLPDDMLDILRYIQEKYVPYETLEDPETKEKVVHISQKVFFGGDNLTVERAVNAQRASADGDNPWDRLEGVVPKNEDWHADRNKFQRIVNKLRKPASAGDPGTMFANATVTNNSTAKLDPLENFTKVKEPFYLYLDAYIVAATMKSLGIDKVTDKPEVVPENIRDASATLQRQWLREFVQPLIEEYVSPSITAEELHNLVQEAEARGRPTYNCSVCGKVYMYQRAMKNHEKNKHGLSEVDASAEDGATKETTENSDSTKMQDHIFNYGCVYITLGLMLRNSEDAVKEGDGERIVLMWKFFMPFWRNEGSTKYALAALHMFADLHGRLSERDAHRLIWNRTINRKARKAKRVSRDFYIETLNLILKDSFRHLGVNVNEQNAAVEGKILRGIEMLIDSHNEDLCITKPSGYHKKYKSETDFNLVLNEIVTKAKMFNYVPGREYKSFPGFSRNILHGLSSVQLVRWIKEHKRKWVQEEANKSL